jgi:PAS domain S-box-containing protein
MRSGQFISGEEGGNFMVSAAGEGHVMAAAEDPRGKSASPDEADALRRRAEGLLDELADGESDALAPDAATLHELRVHQIEIEMQNEELRRSQIDLEESREKYFDLFDLAPVGYLTLNDRDTIGDANLTAARLLGVDRQLLIGKSLSAFVLAADRDAYYLNMVAIRDTDAPLSFALRLDRAGGKPGDVAGPGHFWALLECRPQRVANGETRAFWVAFTDISEREEAEQELRKSEELSRPSSTPPRTACRSRTSMGACAWSLARL